MTDEELRMFRGNPANPGGALGVAAWSAGTGPTMAAGDPAVAPSTATSSDEFCPSSSVEFALFVRLLLYVAGCVGATGRRACWDTPELPDVFVLVGCALLVDFDFFADLLTTALVDLRDGITIAIIADSIDQRQRLTNQGISLSAARSRCNGAKTRFSDEHLFEQTCNQMKPANQLRVPILLQKIIRNKRQLIQPNLQKSADCYSSKSDKFLAGRELKDQRGFAETRNQRKLNAISRQLANF